ncbi:MAG: protein O-GlcNAcase [Rhodanobacter thiooxydans]|nr:protein O-GlcNAcase [Rhodanobacter thiooxydans]
MVPELGVIEGHFGKSWCHEDRKRMLMQLRELGFSWFRHAPKADTFLRRRWREPHPVAAFAELADLSAHCAAWACASASR